MSNELLDCLHGHLDNRRSDLTEQLYIITKLRRYAIKPLYKKMLAEQHRPEGIKKTLLRDGLPSRKEIDQWLSEYGGHYPDWGRVQAPGSCLLQNVIFVIVAGSLLAITGRPFNILVWLGALVVTATVWSFGRRYRNRRWRLGFLRRLEREMQEEGFNRTPSTVAAMGDFDEFMQAWILARRLDGDGRSASELASEAMLVWSGEN